MTVILEGRERTGAVLSTLIVTETESESPTLFVAEQVKVEPSVFEVIFEAVQPDEDEIPDSASSTVQLTVTSLMYQPPEPAVPLMFGVMTGTVVSSTKLALEQPKTFPVQMGLDTI